MKARTLLQVRLDTSASAEDAVAELVARTTGQAASIYCDAETGAVTVCAYLGAGSPTALRHRLRDGLEHLRTCGLDPAPGRISIRRIRREDWAESWRRHFKPFEIAHRLLVKPSWSRRKAGPGQATLILDPGLSFGTGHHPTTRFCLEQIVHARHTGERQSFLDVGCGSGILSLAAAKLGYDPVAAFDVDPEAVRIAGENARRNRLAGRICLRQADLTRLPRERVRQHDVVCANLVYDLLLDARARLKAWVKPGGILVLAGILSHQLPLVRRAYAGGGWLPRAHAVQGEWESLALKAPESLS
ncbi:MAG TPA: 50S ribosomal protein L11 methyltransferase [Methylomirabilota bacterium]|nr:50S ribosomal protein L11 methyltransferase [Methylomirabilota bacterium]